MYVRVCVEVCVHIANVCACVCAWYLYYTCVTYYRYGFDYGNVHVVMMSTEHDFTADSEQLQFLDDHLKKVDRGNTPWLINTL